MEYTVNKFKDFTIHNYEIIDSTNEQAKRISENSSADNLVITADSQAKGRGRLGREWISDEGNLFFSIIIDSKKITPQEMACYVAALSVAEAVNNLGIKTKIKWPNDILINGKKLCGILIEKHKNSLIVGIGINITSNPENLDRNRVACCLNDHVKNIDKQKLLNDILLQFDTVVKDLNKNGFEEIRLKLMSQLYKLNETIELEHQGKKITGVIKDINKNGNLVLESEKLLQEYRVGEIFDL